VTARRAVVVDVVRTPFGKGRESGALAGVHPVDLRAGVLEALLARAGLEPARIDDVVAGCSLPVGEQAGNIARHALLAAGMPVEVPGVTIDRKCGSFQQALHSAAQGVSAPRRTCRAASAVTAGPAQPAAETTGGRPGVVGGHDTTSP
jgi:acetyl-CoA acyltransferase